MTHDQPPAGPSPFRSRAWVVNQATKQELLEYLDCLLVVQRVQQKELKALVEMVVEEYLALQDEMEQAAMEGWHADNAPPRTSWIALGLAGLAGYSLGRSRD